MISVYFENRDFTPYIPQHWESLDVQWYSRNAIGGPKAASIRVFGSEEQMWEFAEMLRCPVHLSDDRPKRTWWGYIHDVEIHTAGGLVYVVSLDSMANNVAVCHTYQRDEFKTAYSSDSDSTDEYGTKDINHRTREITSSLALQLRNTELGKRKYPVPIIKGGSSGQPYAILKCKGWYETLGWRYYLQDGGKEIHEEISTNWGREIGEDNRPIAAQSFQLSSTAGWTATAIWLRVSKYGAPTDNLQIDLYSNDDSDTSPEDSLTGGATTLAGANVNTYYEWTEFTLSSSVALSTGTTYWIHCSRSGAVDDDDHYMIGGGDDYLDGSMKLWNGASWNSEDKYSNDLTFRIIGEEVTTTQISSAVTSIGQFFIGTNILDASGISNQQYRDGDQTGLYEINQLLKTGTTNNRRLLANVTDKRLLEIYEEPPKGEADYLINSRFEIFDENDNPVPPTECPVGKWMRLKDVIPGSANVSRLSDPTTVFIEEARYNAKTGLWQPIKNRDDKPFLPVSLEEG